MKEGVEARRVVLVVLVDDVPAHELSEHAVAERGAGEHDVPPGVLVVNSLHDRADGREVARAPRVELVPRHRLLVALTTSSPSASSWPSSRTMSFAVLPPAPGAKTSTVLICGVGLAAIRRCAWSCCAPLPSVLHITLLYSYIQRVMQAGGLIVCTSGRISRVTRNEIRRWWEEDCSWI